MILLVGPTASGKSAAALTLAERFDGEIVSIDSALVYRDMNIGTAKPTPDELARVPHHLIDLIDPTERYSVARFVTDCLAAIADIQSRGRMPLLVGGTMMYANILVNGMSDVPPADEAIRAGLAARRDGEGIEALHAELLRVDPITAARLPPTDSQRIERALEVWQIAGVPLSSLQGQKKSALAAVPHTVLRWLPRDRAWLHARCEARLTTMFAQGFVAEVEALQKQYALTPDLPSMRCVGYRQVLDALEGRAPKAEMMERALFATRQLAKRQITWLRGFAGAAIDCDAADSVDVASAAIERAIEQSAQVEA
ncbi:MAG: tRNA (adenosine(37)-N6)-dimethylallyltransferase MiaA [Casimicrobium sp.]